MGNWTSNLTSISACTQLELKWLGAASSLVLEMSCRSRHVPLKTLPLDSAPEGCFVVASGATLRGCWCCLCAFRR